MVEPNPDLVHAIDEYLRPFLLKLGPNMVAEIVAGRREVNLSAGERRELAEAMALLVDGLVERRVAADVAALCAEAAGPGYHTLVTVDEARNDGRASITRGMVPIWAAAGALLAGDPVDQVRGEYRLTEAEVAVVAALAEDFTDLAARDEPPPDQDVCRPVAVAVDGQEEVVRVAGAEPMDALDEAMFAELVAAAKAFVARDNPHLGVVQELLGAVRMAAWCIPDGVVHTRFGTSDGGQVKARLKEAAATAREALSPRKDDGDGGADVDLL